MINFLYILIIFPIEQIIEVCFFYGRMWFGSSGAAILTMSVAVSTLVLPIYLMADRQQRRQREIEKGLKKGVDTIRNVFRGDERFMLLSTYYRQNNYHPAFAFRNSIDLLIQIPFFIAAYHFLHTHPEVLNGVSFLFIPDLGSPDRLLLGLNLLPVLMTVINLVSGMIYAKNLAEKDKIQLYMMAGVFLVLLYNSPAGLVLYWTGNNVYNLVKNIIQKIIFANGQPEKEERSKSAGEDTVSASNRIFILSMLSLCFLCGLTIPAGVISSDVSEFAFTGKYSSPISYVLITFAKSFGFFLWSLIIYSLFDKKIKRYLAFAALFVFVNAVLSVFCFQLYYGYLFKDLHLSNFHKASFEHQHITLGIAIVVAAGVVWLSTLKNKTLVYSMLSISLISFLTMGIINFTKIQKDFSALLEYQSEAAQTKIKPVYTFSKTGKNVLVVMLDRAISGFLPYIIEERPDVGEVLSGFTYFPNTVTFGNHTIYSVPGILGGYYYTPLEIQKRTKEKFMRKYMESLQVLPQILASDGFETVVSDLSHLTPAQTSALTDVKNIRYEFTIGMYVSKFIEENPEFGEKDYESILKDNLIRFSFFKCLPSMMSGTFYDYGNYMKIKKYSSAAKKNYSSGTLRNYSHLHYLKDMTDITEKNADFANIIFNELPHDRVFLELPDYTLVSSGTPSGYSGKFAKDGHYHVNAASLLRLKEWFNFLKENEVFDNTRIIIVSDHGRDENEIDVLMDGYAKLPNGEGAEGYVGLLLFKDFNASGEMKTDSAFMTIADVPTIITNGIIENPINPFTKKPLYMDNDNGAVFTTSHRYRWFKKQYKYSYKIMDDEWYHVKENVFKGESWAEYQIKK